MASVSVINPKSDILRKHVALAANCNAARGLADVLRSNLGPRGTLKMLVGGAGQVKVTKDGGTLLGEMQIQHPTAAMIARAAAAQDTMTGDGTTSTVLLIGEILRQAERHITDGVHPLFLCAGIDAARDEALATLEGMRTVPPEGASDRAFLLAVARTALRTKLAAAALAEQMAGIAVDAVLCLRGAGGAGSSIDLHMVEVLHQRQNLATETRLIRGMVMDHGARHPDMPRRVRDCFVLTCNVSLEYEKTEVNSGFFYSSSAQRERLVDAERRFTDDKVRRIIELKRKVCTEENGRGFVVFNQKGIDPPALELLAREDIFALRRVKRRNMERLTLCCGGSAVNSVADLTPEDLGFAGLVYEERIGDDRWTFVEEVKNPTSCAILVKGPNDHTIAQIKDAVRDGLRAVKNALEDEAVVPGAGAFEVACQVRLAKLASAAAGAGAGDDGAAGKGGVSRTAVEAVSTAGAVRPAAAGAAGSVRGKAKFGVQTFAEALFSIPKTLAANSGFDPHEMAFALVERAADTGEPTGLDVYTGKPINPTTEGIWDGYRAKRQSIVLASTLAQQLLLVDEIIKAGKQMGGSK